MQTERSPLNQNGVTPDDTGGNRTFADVMVCQAFLGGCNYTRLLPSSGPCPGAPLAIYLFLSCTVTLSVTSVEIVQPILISRVVCVKLCFSVKSCLTTGLYKNVPTSTFPVFYCSLITVISHLTFAEYWLYCTFSHRGGVIWRFYFLCWLM